MHAIVLGGGIAGLTAAAALAPHGDVTVIERDPMGPCGARRGVPQGAHQHLLLGRGRLALETLAPGIGATLLSRGAVPFDAGADVAWLTPSGWAPRPTTGIEVLGATRSLLEEALRDRVTALPTVEFLTGLAWTGLEVTGAPAAVSGVLVRAGRTGTTSRLTADLVVDATGRGSRGPAILAKAGTAVPRETTTRLQTAHASVALVGAELPRDIHGAHVRSAPPTMRRGGVLLPVENGGHLLTLVGPVDAPPPSDWPGVLDYAGTLRHTLIAEAIRHAEPCGPVATSRSTGNHWRHYELLGDLPDGYLAVGDALCALNPAYQQGMTLAALAAETLANALTEVEPHRAGKLTYRRLTPTLRRAWLIATHESATDERALSTTGLQRGYLRAVARASARSERIRHDHLAVLHLLAPARRLVRPRVLAHALKASLPPSRPDPPTILSPPFRPAPAVSRRWLR